MPSSHGIHGPPQYGTKKSSRVFVALEIATVMPLNRFTRRIILRASITSVILISILFIITYTIILAYVDNHVSFSHLSELEQGRSAPHRHKFQSKLHNKQSDVNDSVVIATQSGVKWRVEDWDDYFADKPGCFKNATFIVILTSSPENRDRRKAIRNTWCKPELYNLTRYSWQCVFLVGQSLHYPTEIMLDSEMAKHGDLLRGSYVDSYRNLTQKVLHGLYWSARSCPTPYLLKTDDDCYVNTPLLFSLLTQNNSIQQNLYVGNIFQSLDKRKVLRNPQNKWAVTFDEYPEKYYPPYASGTGYLLSADVVRNVLTRGKYISYFIHNEDAFIGMVMHHLGVTPVHSSRFVKNSSGWRDCNHLYIMVIHDVMPKHQYTMQETSLRAVKYCSSSGVKTWD